MDHEQRIGIMADSHGQRSAIEGALSLFETQSCDCVYHLGDICDSSHPETAHACVELLRRHRVIAIKGNNDHALVVNHESFPASPVPRGTIAYLKQLPLVRHHRQAVFTHGLPFVAEKGLSCMIGGLGPSELTAFFRQYPQNVLFRGHQHAPEITWRENDKLIACKLEPQRPVLLASKIPCVVTCGASDSGYCLIWHRESALISCHQCF